MRGMNPLAETSVNTQKEIDPAGNLTLYQTIPTFNHPQKKKNCESIVGKNF